MTSLEDKVALITGGSRRIGAATARTLHASGMRLVIHYRSSAESAEDLRAELCEQRPDSVMLIRGDLEEIAKVKNLVREAAAAMGVEAHRQRRRQAREPGPQPRLPGGQGLRGPGRLHELGRRRRRFSGSRAWR